MKISKQIDEHKLVDRLRGIVKSAVEDSYGEDADDSYYVVESEPCGDGIRIEVRAEFGYTDMRELAEKLDKVVQRYDSDAYFDDVDSGIIEAYIGDCFPVEGCKVAESIRTKRRPVKAGVHSECNCRDKMGHKCADCKCDKGEKIESASFERNIAFMCPACHNKTLYCVDKEVKIPANVGYHDYFVCDECGDEFLSEPQYRGDIKFVHPVEDSVCAANYGGAYDIDPEMYWTKDDIMELAYEVCDRLSSDPDLDSDIDSFDVYDCYIEPDNTLTLNVADADGDVFGIEVKIDLRRARTTRQLVQKYAPEIARKLKKIIIVQRAEYYN